VTREVVDAGDGWLAAEGGVAAVMVVEVQPLVELAAPLGVGAVGACVGPFVEQGAVEALNLAVGLGSAGADEPWRDARGGERGDPGS
jgi:hypothetical protein